MEKRKKEMGKKRELEENRRKFKTGKENESERVYEWGMKKGSERKE